MSEWILAQKKTMMPRDTNPNGIIFGGILMADMDLAGAEAAKTVCPDKVVTVQVSDFVFKEPVHVGDVVTYWSRVERIGRTSVTVSVKADVSNSQVYGEASLKVTEATFVYVNIDNERRPKPIKTSQDGDICCYYDR